jgi:hypothetical protein
MQQLPLLYVYIHCLAYPFYTLLASGYFGFGTVSCFLDTLTTIQITRYSGGRCVWFTKRHHHVTWQIAAAIAYCQGVFMSFYFVNFRFL